MTVMLLETGKAGPLFDAPTIRPFFDGVELATLRVKFRKAQADIIECDEPEGCDVCRLEMKVIAGQLARFVEVYGDGSSYSDSQNG